MTMRFSHPETDIHKLVKEAKKLQDKHEDTYDTMKSLDDTYHSLENDLGKEKLFGGYARKKEARKFTGEQLEKNEILLRQKLGELAEDLEACKKIKAEAESLQPGSLEVVAIDACVKFLEATQESVLSLNEPQSRNRF